MQYLKGYAILILGKIGFENIGYEKSYPGTNCNSMNFLVPGVPVQVSGYEVSP